MIDLTAKIDNDEAVQFMKSLSSQQLSQTSSINSTVAMIHNDTQLIEKHTRVLGDMKETLERIRVNTEAL